MNNILRTVCAVLFFLSIIATLNSLRNLPNFYQQALTQTLPPVPVEGYSQASNERITSEAAHHGMSIPNYLKYRIATDLVYSFVFYLVSFLILRRARGQWFLWFTALILFFIPSGQIHFYAPWNSKLTPYLTLISSLWPAVPLFLYLFPNGRAVPRWMLWLLVPIMLIHLFFQAFFSIETIINTSALTPKLLEPYMGIILLSFPLAMVSQVYRYLRISTQEERQQTKWVMSGLIGIVLFDFGLGALFGDINPLGSQVFQGFLDDFSNLIFLVIPITIGISILRYRLYDIDLIIRRTLQYGVLSLMLGLIYFGLVILLGQLFQSAAGQQPPLVIVSSTLVIAALFTPLRRRIQHIIDRRFFRQRYDAGQALGKFTSAARSQVELETMAGLLAKTAQETLQPEGVWVWLKNK
jgi:hypothetical protein